MSKLNCCFLLPYHRYAYFCWAVVQLHHQQAASIKFNLGPTFASQGSSGCSEALRQCQDGSVYGWRCSKVSSNQHINTIQRLIPEILLYVLPDLRWFLIFVFVLFLGVACITMK